MTHSGMRVLRAFVLVVASGACSLVPAAAQGQLGAVVASGSRYAGNSGGTAGFNQDSGAASATSLSAPSYAVFDGSGNLFVSDTQNNCVRKIDTSGNITTVAGLRVNGGPDTCNAIANPTPVQGLSRPTGLAIDASGTLYISDSLHNCVRSLASGAVDSFAANVLTTVAGTCTATDTASVTPAPNGLAVDAGGNLYISIQDTAAATPVNQVLRHGAGAGATAVCYMAGQASANVPNACSGVTGTATLASPAGLAIDAVGDLYIADTGNNCVREIAGLTTIQTAVGKCANDQTGTSTTSLQSPYGLAFTPGQLLLITETGASQNAVVSYSGLTQTLTAVAGLPSGAAGAYQASLDGQSALSTPLNQPLGVAASNSGDVYLADSGDNVVRRFSTYQNFATTVLGSASASQTITFAIYSAANLSVSVGADYTLGANSCTGTITPAASGQSPATCQVTLTFNPTLPGVRSSALQVRDSNTGAVIRTSLTGTATGPLALLTPGVTSTLASGLRNPIAISTDSSGNTFVLEQGPVPNSSDVIAIAAGGGSSRVVVPQGSGVVTPTAMAVDAAGNVYLADGASNTIARFGADGSTNLTYASGLVNPSALVVDAYGDLYVAQAGAAHDVIEIYAGGQSRTVAGAGSTLAANGVAATTAEFVKPTGLALGPNGLTIADASGQYVYNVDSAGIIHIVAGNGSSVTSDSTQATGTAILYPVGIAYDAAGDLYVADEAANRVYVVYPVQSAGTNGANTNIATAVGSGSAGSSDGPALSATLSAPLTLALDGAANLFVVDSGNSSVREVSYPSTATLNFGDVIIGNSPTDVETVVNAGNAALGLTTPITTTDSHFTVTMASSCASTVSVGGTCALGYTFTPTLQGPVSATSTITSTSSTSPFTIQLSGFGLTTQNLPFTVQPETEVYGAAFAQTLSLNVIYPDLAPDGTMNFSISGNQTCGTAAPFGVTVTCNAPNSHLHVIGSPYTVNFTYTHAPNETNPNYYNYPGPTYPNTVSGTTTLTVTPAPLTVTTGSHSSYYGDPIVLPTPSATFTTLVNGDVVKATDTTTATTSSPVGTYPITSALSFIGTATPTDYTITNLQGTYTVLARPLTVTVTNTSRAYGAANPTFNSTTVGAVNGDTFTVTYSTTATTTSPAGTYPITATVTGANIANYAVTVVAGTLTVTPIPLTVNVASATRPYGTANPSFSSSIVGAINGDTFTEALTTTATVSSPVGTYPINDTLSGPAARNYTITVNPGTLTITKATGSLFVTANSASRTYGAANPTFTSTVTGALNNDTFTISYSTAATPASPVGTYAITPVVSGAAAANYNIVTANGTLTVTPATLTVAVNSVSRAFGAANPIFTGVVTGAQNGDAVGAVYVTAATATSAPGVYPITATLSGAALTNYTANIVPGTLTITLAGTSTTIASSGSPVNAGASVTFTAHVSSGAGVPTGIVTFTSGTTTLGTGTVDGSGNATFTTSTLAPGTLTITATYSGSATFGGSSASLTEVVSPGSFTLTATPPSQFVRGGGTTVYVITATSVNGYAGPVTLSCAGLPSDASCSFSPASITLASGATATTNMTVVNTAADAKLQLPELPQSGTQTRSAPVAFSLALPFELTGLGVFFGIFGRRRRTAAGKLGGLKFILAVVCTAGLLGLAGCACFTSTYQNYTINVTGTTTVQGVASQSTSVILSVGQQ